MHKQDKEILKLILFWIIGFALLWFALWLNLKK